MWTTSMLNVLSNKSWKLLPTDQQLYNHLPPISQIINIRQIWCTGYCWISRNKLISKVLQWVPIYELASVGWPAKTNIHQLCADTVCHQEDLSRVMADRDRWWDRIKEIWCYQHNLMIMIYIISIYRYHTMTDVYTAALLPTKPSSDDDSGFRHGFRAEASLPLTQIAPAVTHNTTRLCWIDVTLWDCHIYADAVRALS